MATISRTAQRQTGALKSDYRRKNRPEAIRNLRRALIEAEAAINDPATKYRNFPATYGSLARNGRWILVPIYWVSYKPIKDEMAITNAFWNQADIPARYKPNRASIAGGQRTRKPGKRGTIVGPFAGGWREVESGIGIVKKAAVGIPIPGDGFETTRRRVAPREPRQN